MAYLFDQFPRSIDAFGRYRVSNPESLFNSKQLASNQALFWDDQQTSGAGTSSTYNTNQASTTIAVGAATAGTRVRQTFRSFNYQAGKAIRHGEPVLTPSGWIKIEDVKLGDVVFDGLGHPTKVIGVYPQGVRELYRMTFDDGTHVDCDGEHLWKTTHRNNRDYPGSNYGEVRVLTTRQMLEEYGEEPPAFARWRIPAAPVLNIAEREVPVDPYTLGAILGDGSISRACGSVGFTSADPEIVANLKAEVTQRNHKLRTPADAHSYGILGMGAHMRALGLAGTICFTKFVPDVYKYNSTAVRLGVLQGLMDTDGDVDKRDGTTSYTSVSRQLADDVAYLVRSLGGQAKIKTRTTKFTNTDGDRVKGALSYRVRVIMPECPFRLGRKTLYWKARTRISFDRYVHSIKPIGEGEATCIRVESEDHTFLTRNHIVTHNSQLINISLVLGTAATGIRRRVGLFNSNNGLFLQQTATNLSVVIRSFTSGAPVDTVVNQSTWNLDTLDGTGPNSSNPSGVLFDASKIQLLVIDFQWLGTGQIRFGFYINGSLTYVHAFENTNALALVYMQNPNLPLRYEINNDGTGGAAGLVTISTSVMSEGGQVDNGFVLSADRGDAPLVTLNNAAIYPLVAIRLKSAALFAQVEPIAASIVCTSNAAYRLVLLLNPTVVGTALSFASVNADSAVEADVTATNATTLTGGTQLDSAYGQAATEGSTFLSGLTSIQLGATIAGVSDILVFAVQRMTVGGGAETFYGALTWRESR